MSKKIIVYTIVVISFLIRTYHLTTLVPALFSDEVDAGYQALTFNQNGTDYFGNKLPIHFHSFSDWRTSLYIYSIAIFQKIGIPHELSVRLPSAVFGSISVYIFYLITNSISASILLSISPWAIHYSRTGFEVSGMIMCILACVYFWQQYSHNKHLKFLLLSTLFLCLSPFFYSTSKLFIIIIGPLLVFIWRPKYNHLIIACIFSFIILLPMLSDSFLGRSGFRFSYISIFTEPHREQTTDTLRYQDILLNHPNQIGIPTPPLSFIFHNKYQLVVSRFINNYLSSFSPEFLLITGDKNVRQGFGGHGLLYSIDFLFLIIGFIYFVRQPNHLGLLFFWILILSPIPFALTRDSLGPHSTRLILMLPSLIYFTSLSLRQKPFLIIFYIISFINFGHYYINHYPQDSARSWHAGLRQAVEFTALSPSSTLYFSDSSEPFLPFFLFYFPYLPHDPIVSHLKKINNNFFDGQCLDNHYCFGRIIPQNISSLPDNSLLIIPVSETFTPPPSFNLIHKVTKKFQNSEEFLVYSNNL